MGNIVLKKIVSGGQTGVDQGALDAAIDLQIDHGGWCPQGRRSETGRIARKYRLDEIGSRNYAVRTERNVIDSDGTLILYRDQMSGGTELTHRFAVKHDRPCLAINLLSDDYPEQFHQISQWLSRHAIETLNVAGPRESSRPGIQAQTSLFLIATLRTISPVNS